MLIFDLKTSLFFLLLIVSVGIALVVMLIRRQSRSSVTPHSNVSLLSVLDAAPFGLLILDAVAVTYANAYAQRLLRLPSTRGDLPDADWRPLLEADRLAVRQSGVEGRYRNITFASGNTARWWVIPWRTQDFVFLLDITTQQRTEQAGRALINDLAHEMRTPIATILTHLEILGLDDVGDDVRQQSLTLSQAEAQRMARLLNDMLELGRLETTTDFPCRPVDLMSLVEDVVLQATPRAAERQMALTLEAASPLPWVLGNADRLRQVFLNLVDNALKYAHPDDQINVSLQRSAEGIVCAVCDTGPGIAAEHLPHVARRFYRAAAQHIEGSGLGLALVAEILRRHESVLDIQSPVAEERGLCARFVLRIAAEG